MGSHVSMAAGLVAGLALGLFASWTDSAALTGAHYLGGNRRRSERALGVVSEDRTMNDTTEVIRRFNDAFQRHDGAVFADLAAEDCVIENTTPAPDGARHVGRAACVELWPRRPSSTVIRFARNRAMPCAGRTSRRVSPGSRRVGSRRSAAAP